MMTLKRNRAHAAGALLSFATLGVVALHAAPAAAGGLDTEPMADREHREPFCPFASGPSCTHSFLFDVLAGYQRDINDAPGSKNFSRLGGELGYLGRLGDLSSQLGLVTEIGGVDSSDLWGWYVAPKLRLRWWPVHWFIGVELSGGALFTATHYVKTETVLDRFGARAELGVTFLGAVTFVTGVDWLRSTDGVSSEAFFIGGRTTILVPLAVLAR